VPNLRLSGAAGAAGTVTLTVWPRDATSWRITQVSVEATAGSASAVSGSATGVIRKNGFPVAPFVAQLDAVAGDPPVDLQPGDELTIEWTGLTSGNVVKALVFYEPVT
jgi:hypothetical protein